MPHPTHSSRLALVVLFALTGTSTVACRDTGVSFSVQVYRTVDGRELSAHIFDPPRSWWAPDRAAIVIFHGGAWKAGGPELAHPYCRYFAERGMVAIAAEYRLADGGKVTPLDAMDDARQLLRWVRANAGPLAVDPRRVAAGGWSAGGHLATMAAISSDESPDAPDSSPDALVLWFPSVAPHLDPTFLELLQQRADPTAAAPVRQVRPGLPPTVIFQGNRDRTTPLASARSFCQQMTANGDRCVLHVYKGRGHVFTHQDDDFIDTVVKADEFLTSLGFLAGAPDPELLRRTREELALTPPGNESP